MAMMLACQRAEQQRIRATCLLGRTCLLRLCCFTFISFLCWGTFLLGLWLLFCNIIALGLACRLGNILISDMAIFPGLANFVLIRGLKFVESVELVCLGERLLHVGYDGCGCATPMTPGTIIGNEENQWNLKEWLR